MKILIFSLMFLSLIIAGAYAQTSFGLEEPYYVKNYVNDEFGITATVPNGWVIFDELESDENWVPIVAFTPDPEDWSTFLQINYVVDDYDYDRLSESEITQELSLLVDNWCDDVTYGFDGYICYNYELDSEVPFDDDTFLISSLYTLRFTDGSTSTQLSFYGVSLLGNGKYLEVDAEISEHEEKYRDDMLLLLTSLEFSPDEYTPTPSSSSISKDSTSTAEFFETGFLIASGDSTSATLPCAASESNTGDVHIWYESVGTPVHWLSLQELDCGIIPPGHKSPSVTWHMSIPENTPEEKYSFDFIQQCETWPKKLSCGGDGYIIKYTFQVYHKGGGCLIATATYGSELAPQVQLLREIRDKSLLQTESGTSFMNTFNDVYYSFSPIIADYERENPVFKEAVKITLTPLINSLSILNYVDMDSEAEVLGYGISLIVLNLAMYVGVPIVAVIGIRKHI